MSAKIDALIAENVMGWRPHVDLDFKPPQHEWRDCGGSFMAHQWHPDQIAGLKNWSPATNIADAWEVVEKLRQTHCCIKVYSDHAYIYECTMVKDPYDDHEGRPMIFGQAETAPLAICLAALKAVGVEVPK